MNSDLLKVLITPLLGAGIQWWTSAKSKTKLKTDIELLELYQKIDSTSTDYTALKSAITARLKKAYKVDTAKPNDTDWSDFFWGVVLASIALAVLAGWIDEDNVLKFSICVGFGLGAAFAFHKAFERWF